jgi:TRAP-type C4-dicarboxylate transport system permease small subunit
MSRRRFDPVSQAPEGSPPGQQEGPTLNVLKRFDEGIARGEAALATVFLIAMVVSGAAQAFFRFCATRVGWEAANAALQALDWVDPLLQKGTMWLAFLGASLATRESRHVAIDIVPRLVPHKGKLLMRGLVGLGSAAVAFTLSVAFWLQVRQIAEEASAFRIFADSGDMVHVCDATAAELEAARETASPLYCGMRSAFRALGVPLENPQAALQFVIPVMFVIIGARLLANGLGAFLSLNKPPSEADAEHLAPPVEPQVEGEEG